MNPLGSRSVAITGMSVAVMLIACLLIPIPSVRADVADLSVGETTRVYFNWDFEREVVGTMPDAGWYALGTTMTHENLTLTTAAPGGWDDGQVLELKADGLTPEDVAGYAYTGYECSGFVNLSVDFNLVAYNWTYPWGVNDGSVSFGLFHSASFHASGAALTGRNATHGNLWMAGMGALTPVELNTWHTLTGLFDTIADTIIWSVDGVYQLTQNFATSQLSFFGVKIVDHSEGDGQLIQVYFDNIVVSQTVAQTTSFCDVLDDRTAVGLIFDDGTKSIYELAFPVLGDDPAAIAVITYNVENELPYSGEDLVNWTDLNEMQDAGWEVMSHSHTHNLFAGLSEAQQRTELSTAKTLIETNMGEPCRGFVYPGSSRTEATDAVAYEYHEYLRISGKDIPQINFNSKYVEYNRSLDDWGFFGFGWTIPAAVYGHYGYLGLMTHQMQETGPYDTYACNYSAFALWAGKLQENNSRFVTPTAYWLEWRNAWYADLSLDGPDINIDYPDDGINRTFDDVWIRFTEGWMYGIGNWYLDSEYSYGQIGVGDYSPCLSAISDSVMNITISTLSQDAVKTGRTAMAWSVDSVDVNASISFGVYGLRCDVGYKVYQDGEEVWRQHSGPSSVIFTVTGNSEFEVVVWDPFAIMDDTAALIFPIGICIGIGAILMALVKRGGGRG